MLMRLRSALFVLALTSTAFAREPTAGDLNTARNALREGLQTRERGDVAGALGRLQSAYDLVQTPITAFELGKTHQMAGHLLQALELFKKVERMPPSLEESSRSQSARDEAAKLSKEIEPRIPSVKIKLKLEQGASAVVRIDEEIVAMTGAETVRSVEVGPHDVIAKSGDGPEQKVHIELAEAQTKDVELAPKWVKPKDPVPETKEIFAKQTNPLAFIGFSVSAIFAIATGITAVVAVNERSAARDRCSANYCPPRSETQLGPTNATVGDLNFTQTSDGAAAWTLVSVLCGAGSLLLFGVGVVGLTRPIKERVVSIHPTPNGFAGTF